MPSLLLLESPYFSLASKKSTYRALLQFPVTGDMLRDQKKGKTRVMRGVEKLLGKKRVKRVGTQRKKLNEG